MSTQEYALFAGIWYCHQSWLFILKQIGSVTTPRLQSFSSHNSDAVILCILLKNKRGKKEQNTEMPKLIFSLKLGRN